MTDNAKHTPYTAEITPDPELQSDIITLRYTDPHDPARNLTASISPEFGSNLFRLQAGAHALIYCDTNLLKNREFTGIFVLWPLPNRIRDKRYTFEGKTYSLAAVKRPGKHDWLIHGLVFDRPWQYDEPVAGQHSASVTTHVDLVPGSPYYDAFPFDSRLSLTYTLIQNSITVTYTVQNKGTQAMPSGFALHPYFSLLSGKENTLVSLPFDAVMEADEKLLPTGRVLDVNTDMYAMFDLRQPVPISHLKLDHVYMDVHSDQNSIITYRDQSLQIRISATPDFTHSVIYTLSDDPCFCLENQTCSTDAVNLYAQGRQDIAHLQIVPPGESLSGHIHYEIAAG
jgi:aldose 1-epimerase